MAEAKVLAVAITVIYSHILLLKALIFIHEMDVIRGNNETGALMKRDALKELLRWKDQKDRLPLLVCGARQVGKSYLVQELGAKHFENFVEINFEYQPEAKQYFTSLDPIEIVNKIRLTQGTAIMPGKTLLFLDEIQECPEAITALRYFYEKMPMLHVIAAGSLLEFVFHQEKFRMPVGRVQYLFIKPLSFGEFLCARGFETLRDYLNTITLKNRPEEVIHEKLLKLLREYMVLGGMPKAIHIYLESSNIHDVQRIQTSILATYQDDFGKYANSFEMRYLQVMFRKTPFLISQRFFYKDVDLELRSRELKRALELLQQAFIIHTSHAVSASGLPLKAQVNEKQLKIFFVDIGLVNRSNGLSSSLLLEKDVILVNRGSIAEQFVAQELIAYSDPYAPPELYWWTREVRGSSAEVDFLTTKNTEIFPIEVKAGTVGRMRSLKIFLEEKKSSYGLRISQNALSFEDHVLSIPFYLIEQLDRLLF